MADEQNGFESWAIVEEWRPAVGFEGIYEVDAQGRIRRVGRAARRGAGRGGGARIGRMLRTHRTAYGYVSVQLWRDGKPQMRLVHTLVAAAFIGPCPPGNDVNHRDGVKTNNCHTNLEYLSRGENNAHAYRTGLRVASVDQAVAARRKPRSMVDCQCGCGAEIETPDSKGRLRRFVVGHAARRRAT